jgi:S-adenosylmethionine-diacylglycerol 3-amino-3-carboxypropyl transferase
MIAPQWLEQASQWPVAFAQVREDPAIDCALVERLSPGSSLVMIASGGCTAAALARQPNLSHITLVDANPAQLALTRLKLQLLAQLEPPARLALLGHAPMAHHDRERQLSEHLHAAGLAADSLGSLGLVARTGPDFSGRYEQLFAALQASIASDLTMAHGLQHLLLVDDTTRQSEWLAANPTWWQQLEKIFEVVFDLPNLTALFGDEATRNPYQPFAQHFLEQLRKVLTTLNVRRNPFVWQLLTGRYPELGIPDWLTLPPDPLQPQWAWVLAPIGEFLQAERARHPPRHHMLHLSNVLDWLPPTAALAVLQAAWACTVPGGWLIVRQLNSTLDICSLGEQAGWRWDTNAGAQWLQADRSFFYRQLHVGRKP